MKENKKRLELLVPHYNAPEETLTNLLDMISVQRDIDFSEIGVIIGNDGDKVILSDEFLDKYRKKFDIRYEKFTHKGVSATRNRLLDLASAEFVMFCDDDDTFLSNISLSIIFKCLDKFPNFNVCRTGYKCELHVGGEIVLSDATSEMFSNVHGVIFRRTFLIDNGIRFYENISMHEDAAFNILLGSFLNKDGEHIINQTQTYLYCHNDNSICKANTDDSLNFVDRSFDILVNSRFVLFRDMIERGIFSYIDKHIIEQSCVLFKFWNDLISKIETYKGELPINKLIVHYMLCLKRLKPIVFTTLSNTNIEKFKSLFPFSLFGINQNDMTNELAKKYYDDVINMFVQSDAFDYTDDPIVEWNYNISSLVPYFDYDQSCVARFIKSIKEDQQVDLSEAMYRHTPKIELGV